MSRRKVGQAGRSRSAKLRYELSSQIQLLLAKSLEHGKLDQTIVKDMHRVASVIYRFNEAKSVDSTGREISDKEGRALRLLLNQVEERIEFLAQQRVDQIITSENRAPALNEDIN